MTRTNGQSVFSEAGDLMDSTLALGQAATKFAMDQMETVLCAFSSPGRAMERLKRSINNVSNAMNAPVLATEEGVENGQSQTRPVSAFSGRKI